MISKSMNIYLHDTSKHNQFIVEQIIPLQKELSFDKPLNNFILRHWRKGPHIQWHIQLDKNFSNEKLLWVQNKLTENIEKYSAAVTLTQSELEEKYLLLKDFEMEVGDLFPIEDDATIKLTDSSLRVDIWGENGVQSIRKYYIKTNDLVMSLIKEPANNKYKNTLSMMMAAIYAIGNPNHHQLSFRSHSEAFLNRFDKEDKLREQFEKVYKINNESIKTLFDVLLDTEKLFHQWKNVFQDLIKENEPLIAKGQLLMPEAETYMNIVKENNWDKGYEGKISEFHENLNSIPIYDKIKKTKNFQIKRLVLNFLYLTIAQIGIKPVEKFSMCYSISRFFEEKMGESWKEQLNDETRFTNIN